MKIDVWFNVGGVKSGGMDSLGVFVLVERIWLMSYRIEVGGEFGGRLKNLSKGSVD